MGMLGDKKVYIFDMDGTIYLGARVFDFAVHLINRLREDGRRVIFFTNNSSHNGDFYLAKLTRMGFSPAREEIMTSGDVTIDFLLRHRPGKRVFLLGNEELRADFTAAGVPLAAGDEPSADILVSAFDTTLTYEKLTSACRYLDGGAEFLSTHPDFRCPTEDGFIPDSGAICAALTAATGKTPVYFGKPYEQTVEAIGNRTGAGREEMCIFGDRLYTDIAFGRKYGITAVLVMTGETTDADLAAAEGVERPDLVFPSLAEAETDIFGK